MKTGIMGGTFDPIDKVHIKIAKAAIKQYGLDRVFIMPSPNPPHKTSNAVTSVDHRINMVKLAIKGKNKLKYSDLEIKKNPDGYTADTLTILKYFYPKDKFYFIMGSDSLASFPGWYRPELIAKQATLLVVKRGNESTQQLNKHVKDIKKRYNAKIKIIEFKASNLSSTEIRKNFYNGESNNVCRDVREYIINNKLYTYEQKKTPWTVDMIDQDLKNSLKHGRYVHSIGVAETAAKMAASFNVNTNTAYLAGLLHDCAKNMPDKDLLDFSIEKKLGVSKFEKAAPYLLHGKVGAYIAEHKYNITDEDVLNAISYHTTGRPAMSKLEKIIFSADYIEPGRNKQPNLGMLRYIANKDLDLLVYLILKDTCEYLKADKPDSTDDMTLSAYEYYRDLIENKNSGGNN